MAILRSTGGSSTDAKAASMAHTSAVSSAEHASTISVSRSNLLRLWVGQLPAATWKDPSCLKLSSRISQLGTACPWDLYRQSGGLPKHAGCCHYAIGQLPEPVREGSKP